MQKVASLETMNIELIKEESKVGEEEPCEILPEEFCLTDFGKAWTKGCTVQKEVYEKWLPEPKPPQFNWIVEEIVEPAPIAKDAYYEDGEFSENNQSNAVMVREFTMTALPQETGEQIDISNVIYPVVNDPFMMGQIACVALLNKLFIMRIYTCDRVVFMLAVCKKWTQSEQDIVEKSGINGFKQKALEAKIAVNEAEVHTDTTCMIGGMLTAVRPTKHTDFPNNAVIGDVIVLTKPLGVQTALNAYKVYQEEQTEMKDRLCRAISKEDLTKAYEAAIYLLTTLNLSALKLTEGHDVHAATEINGNSLMEHAQLLAEQQSNEVAFYIYNLPLVAKMLQVSKALGNQTELIQGNSQEICGGLLLVMPREQAANYCRHVLNEGSRAWIIGVVEKGQRTANMIKKARIIDWIWKG